ncbi:MAG: M20/M25/M40 family metallo-hydrolase [Eubacterium sp.]|nr:M20/M25/M40 family metallo-hydrolase [Eubacterium sp.]
MVNKDRILENFTSMVALDSPSFDERLVCDFIKNYLKTLGIDAHEDGAGAKIGGTTGNLIAYVDGDINAAPLMFSSHMDTVEPSHGKKAVIHDDGTITSAGDTVLGSDDLAGVVSILEALTVINENNIPHRPLELVFTVSEETHGGGATALEYDKLKSKQAYVFDLDGEIGTAASSAPTILAYKAEFIGKSAHAGFAAHLGIHAVKAAALAVTRIPCGAVEEGVNANVGVIEGGKATNIVPDLCTIKGEIRSFDDAKSDVKFAEVKKICEDAAAEFGAKVEFETSKDIRAFNVADDNPVVERFKTCCNELGLEGRCEPTFGGSDNNVFSQHGIDGIVVSTGMNNCHSVDEFTTVDGLVKAAELALKLMTTDK